MADAVLVDLLPAWFWLSLLAWMTAQKGEEAVVPSSTCCHEGELVWGRERKVNRGKEGSLIHSGSVTS